MSTDRPEKERIRGTNPATDQMQAVRSVGVHARFFAQHLRPGMRLLDCGCGRGSITLGLAGLVAPGEVEGVDLDAQRIEDAKKLAESQGVENVHFQVADIYELPFPDASFDGVYEHALFQHLDDPVRAAKEVMRVLKPGALFGASDRVQTQGIIVSSEALEAWTEHYQIRRLFHAEQGSDMNIGLRLHSILSEAGFVDVVPSASLEVFATPREKRTVVDFMIAGLRDDRFRDVAARSGLADEAKLERHVKIFEEFAASPDAWAAGANGEVVGWKAAPPR